MKCPICTFQAKRIYYKNINKQFICKHCDIYFFYSVITNQIIEFTKFIELNEIDYIIHWSKYNKTEIWKGAAATEDDLIVTFNFWLPIMKNENAMINKLKTILTFY